MDSAKRPQVYEIQVLSELDAGWQQWFEGLDVTVTDAGEQLHTTTLFVHAALGRRPVWLGKRSGEYRQNPVKGFSRAHRA